TAALGATGRRRADVAQMLLREGTATPRGRLAMVLVLAEEAVVRRSIETGRISRWRFLIRYPPGRDGGSVDGGHSRDR
ncbi:MAG TPA: hypothetical protein VNF73_16950, partial [Candidatus Saccharimonadales bacterium]|nr:hypothetical protein [Candidatus Saccharimonadales bacterium]